MYKFFKVNIELFQDKINLIMNNNSISNEIASNSYSRKNKNAQTKC